MGSQRDANSPANSNDDMLKEDLALIQEYTRTYLKLSEELFDVEINPSALTDDEAKAEEFDRVATKSKQDCQYLLSQRLVYRDILALENAVRGLTTAYEDTPENDHTSVLDLVCLRSKDLEVNLLASSIPEEEELRGRANAILERSATVQGRVAGLKIIEAKPEVKATTKTNVKLKYIDIPTFSGKTEDWLPFKCLFYKAVHNNEELDDDTKLTYLVQAMKNERTKAELSERLDEPGAYAKILAELEQEHDKPRWMHRRYCEAMKNLSTNPHTREGMKQLISQVQVILNGFIRLKGEDCRYILTSMTEAVLDPQLRALWNQRTDTKKTTPPIEDLLQFIKDQADQLEDNTATTTSRSHGGEKPRSKPFTKYKGSTHSVVRPLPTSHPRGNQHKSHQPSTSRPLSPQGNHSASCILCQGGHSLFYCPTFEGYTVVQRKDYVMNQKLCLNCLKAHHVAKDCNSSFICRVTDCSKKHNTLLHEERPVAPSMQQAPHQSNAATHSDDEEDVECLLMTTKVTLVGPTGKMITVRALLDAGSTLSIVSTRLMKFLQLKKTGRSVTISGIKSKSNKQTHPLAKVTLASQFTQDWKKEITVAGLDDVIRQLPQQSAHSVRKLPHIKDLVLADDQFDQPGKIELLLGQNVWRHVLLDDKIKGTEEHHPEAWLTVFGWTILGAYNSCAEKPSTSAITHVVASVEEGKTTDQLLARFFEVEEPPVYKTEFSPEEIQVEAHFQETHSYDPKLQRYEVKLPKIQDPPALGESRTQAVNRAKANERSLIKKDKLESFQQVMNEYINLGHAQQVNSPNQQPQDVYYMPVHAVFKESSTTTKTRAVFDASAKTSSNHSLNDVLAVGPTLHPTIDKVLLRFRTYTIALSSDITKMYREVLLHEDDQPLHRFIWRPDQTTDWLDYEMKRVTFGVASSPYLAVKALQQAAEDFGKEHIDAQWHIKNSFYVDDFLAGASTTQEAIKLYQDLTNILSKASFFLRKWRSNSNQVLKKIPKEIQEAMPTQELIDQHSATYPKALGVAWDSKSDTMYTSINLSNSYNPSKRGVISDVARTFDVLGWISPVILPMKVLYRDLWIDKIDWDEDLAENYKSRHRKWREELPHLSSARLPRHYFHHRKPCSIQLHGFSDASKEAYGAVIFIRATYPDGPPTVELVTAKSKVTPMASRSIPQLELCGATLLAKLMTTTRQTLDVPIQDVYVYTDSTIVLAWLDGQAKRYCIYSANRISTTIKLLPSNRWRHVPTSQNPADAVSRGVTAEELKNHPLWWHGPPWLHSEPIKFPPQPLQTQLNKLKEVEAKPAKKTVAVAIQQEEVFESKFNSHDKMIRVFCWMRRFMYYKTRRKGPLNVSEVREANLILLQRSQRRAFPDEIKCLQAKPPREISTRSSILVLRPKMDMQGLLRIGGRLNQTSMPDHQKHPPHHFRQGHVHHHSISSLPPPTRPLWPKHSTGTCSQPVSRRGRKKVSKECVQQVHNMSKSSSQSLYPASRTIATSQSRANLSISSYRNGLRWALCYKERAYQETSHCASLLSSIHLPGHKSSSS